MNITRRTFLGSTALLATLPGVIAQDYGGKKIPIGIQLYTVGGDLKKDAPGTLAQLAKWGYKGVEFAGFPTQDAKELRKMLDDNGLKCCGSHTRMHGMQGDALAKTIEFAKTIGNTRLIAPSLFGNFSNDAEKDKKMVEDMADAYTEVAAKLKPEGLRTGFHCHPGEFKKIGDSTVWDIFFNARART